MTDENKSIDLRTLKVQSAMELTLIPLNVALLLDSWRMTSFWAEVLQHVTRWIALPFQSLSHATEILNQRRTHIFVTHWHIGNNYDFDSDITRLVKGLRKIRGLPGVGCGPLLVASYRTPFRAWVSGDVTSFLEDTYDCSFDASYPKDPPEFPQWLAEQLWLQLPSRLQN